MCAPCWVGLGLRGVQARAHVGFEFEPRLTGQRPGRNVEFDVVSAEFGLKRGVGDRGEHLAVGHRRLVVLVDEVALDLHAGERAFEVEAGLREHGLEHVQRQLHLAPVVPALGAGERGGLDFLAHTADATRPCVSCQRHPVNAGILRTLAGLVDADRVGENAPLG